MRKLLMFLPAIFISLALTANQALAIGIINKPLIIDNAPRGETFVDELSAFNSDATDALFALTAEGDISEWVTFYLPEDLENPITEILAPTQAYAKAVVNITLPEDIANGQYFGTLSVTLKPLAENNSTEGTKSNVTQRLSRQVTINVTGIETPKLQVSAIPKSFDIANGEPLNIRLIYDNQGNIKLSPPIKFTIYKLDGNDKNQIYTVIYPYSEAKPVKAGEIKEITALTVPTTDLKKGQYIAEMQFLHKDKPLTTEDFKFNVGAQAIAGVKIASGSILVIGLLAVIVALAAAIVIMHYRYPQKRAKSRAKSA